MSVETSPQRVHFVCLILSSLRKKALNCHNLGRWHIFVFSLTTQLNHLFQSDGREGEGIGNIVLW